MKTKKDLSTLVGIPRLETDSEGMLKGGFTTIAASLNGTVSNGNCDCNSAQKGCAGNKNCDCNGGCDHNANCNCDCGTTPIATPAPSNPGTGTIVPTKPSSLIY